MISPFLSVSSPPTHCDKKLSCARCSLSTVSNLVEEKNTSRLLSSSLSWRFFYIKTHFWCKYANKFVFFLTQRNKIFFSSEFGVHPLSHDNELQNIFLHIHWASILSFESGNNIMKSVSGDEKDDERDKAKSSIY